MVDSHCHLDVTEKVSGLPAAEAVELAAQVGVTRIVQIGCDLEGAPWAVQAAERWSSVVAGVAIHPNDAAQLGSELAEGLGLIEQLARHPRVRAVGETGLTSTGPPMKGAGPGSAVFRGPHHPAKAYDKTLVIHDREALGSPRVLDAEGTRSGPSCTAWRRQFARACLDRALPVHRRDCDLQERSGAAGGSHTSRPAADRDRRALPDMTPFRGKPNASYDPARCECSQRSRVDLTQMCAALSDNADAAFGGCGGVPGRVRRRRMVRR